MVNTVVGGGGGGKGGTVVRAHATHQCGPDSNPGVAAIGGLSLLLVLSFTSRRISPGTPVSPPPPLSLKTNTWQIPIRSGTHGHVSKSS